MADREKHIKNLSYIMDSMPDDVCGDWRDSLAYAISSLKTDDAYQLMYEGVEVYDKDTVAWMFRELQLEIEEKHREEEFMNEWSSGYNSCIVDVYDSIQQKINALKGVKE